MYDKSYTYTYRTGMSEGPILGNHMHIYYEFLQLIEGNALYNVEGTEYKISSGDLLITNPNEFHFITFPKNSVYDFMVSTYAAQLVVKLSEILKKEFLVNDTSSKNKHIKEIQNYIEQNFTHNLNIDDIAEHMFLNKAYISRLFKSETGLTISVYINMRRVMMAKNLLLVGENAMNIFYKCGFSDYTTFYRVFKKYTDMSPEQFKKKHSNI